MVAIVPLGQLGPLDALCSQFRVLVFEHMMAGVSGGIERNGWFLLGGSWESEVEANVIADNLRKT